MPPDLQGARERQEHGAAAARGLPQVPTRGIAFASLTERIDTRSPTGQLVFHMFGARAKFERKLIRERTMAGLKAARARGRKGGRPRKLTPKDLKTVRALLRSGDVPISTIAEQFRVARSTLYRNCAVGA